MDGLRWLVLIVSAIFLHSIPAISARGCGSGLQLRDADPEQQQQIDLSGLSPWQLRKLLQQLSALQKKGDEDDQAGDEDGAREEPAPADLKQEEDYEEDHRGSSRPWNRVQRIIRRQLVKIPKRYLKKILRQFGLARSIDGVMPELEEYYLIPLE